jgi:hypothetical protein
LRAGFVGSGWRRLHGSCVSGPSGWRHGSKKKSSV